MAAYGKRASDKVGAALHEEKQGQLKSGSTGKPVTSRKQAIAIGLSEARKAGAKVPPPLGKSEAKKATAHKTPAKKAPVRTTAVKKAPA